MNILSHKAKEFFQAFIAVVISSILVFLLIWVIGKDDDKQQKTLIEYLKKENQQLQKQIQSFQDSIKSVNTRIDGVVESERKLSEEQSEIKTNIKNLKPKYEKAASRSANFTADSIRRYFADL